MAVGKKSKIARKAKRGIKKATKETARALQKRYGTTTKKKADRANKKRVKRNARSM